MTNKVEPKFIARYRESDMQPQCLWEHLLAVSEQTGKFSRKVGLERIGRLIGLIHDLGKVSKEFKEYLKHGVGLINNLSVDLQGRKLDHATAGAQVLYEAFLSPNGNTTFTADILALTVASHHGFMDALTPDGIDTLATRLSKSEAETRKEQALASLEPDIAQRLHDLLDSNINREIEIFLANAQREEYTGNENRFNVALLVRLLLSCLIDADRLNAADFDSPNNLETRQFGHYTAWSVLIGRIENHLSKYQIRHEIDLLRRDISEKCLDMAEQEPGFFRLTVPTGGGKTMASLRFALHHAKKHNLERIIYIIPYTSIIDQNAARIREALEVEPGDTSIVLEHHSNLTPNTKDKNNEEGEKNYARYKLLAENWDSPIILTTMVQFLETLYGAGTNSCRRMHSLANSVIIFDEIQTLPVNQIHLFNLAAKFLVQTCGTSVMLCTATQPILHDLKMPPRSLPFDAKREITVTKEQRRSTLNRVKVFNHTKPRGWNHQEIADLALDESNPGKSVLVIVNTKKNAANIFRHLKSLNNAPVYHLSTNMCPAHRMVKLKEIITSLEQEQPLILISTQLIEAGVDVDFDVVIRSLAGIDSVAQAAGRCNRHGSKPYRGRVVLINSNEETLTMLPEIAIAQKNTERLLEEFKKDKDGFFQGHLLSDPALERYFQYHFYKRRNLMDYPLDQKSPVGRSDTLVDLLSSNVKSVKAYQLANQNQMPNRRLCQSFRTAAQSYEVIPNTGHGLIVQYGEGREIVAELAAADEPKKQFEALRKAQRFSVNCFLNELMSLDKAQALHEVQQGSGILYLNDSFYHDELGWTNYMSSKMPTTQV